MSSFWEKILSIGSGSLDTGGSPSLSDLGIDLGGFGDAVGDVFGNALTGSGMAEYGLDSMLGGIGTPGQDFFSGDGGGLGGAGSMVPGAGQGYALMDFGGADPSWLGSEEVIGSNLDRTDWLSGLDQTLLDNGMTVNEQSARAGYGGGFGLSNNDMTVNERSARAGYGNSPGFGEAMKTASSGGYNPNRSFTDRLKDAASNPNTWLKAGLSLAAGGGGGAPTNTRAAMSKYNAEDAAARAENAGLRTQINNDARNLQESGGANAFRSAQVRGANEVDALKRQLGYTNSPTFVKDALVNKAKQRAGLNAQTAAVSGDVAARNAAAGLYRMAPEPSTAGLSYASALDQANARAKKDQLAGIGSAVEDIFGYKQDEAYKKSKLEG